MDMFKMNVNLNDWRELGWILNAEDVGVERKVGSERTRSQIQFTWGKLQ